MAKSQLIGVTLEFEDGAYEVSDEVTLMYISAPDMYKILKLMLDDFENGLLDIPPKFVREMKKLVGTDAESIRGNFKLKK